MGSNLRVTPADLPDSIQVRLARMYPGAKYMAAARVIAVPLPAEGDLIAWTANFLDAIFPLPVKSATEASPPDANPA